MVLSERFGVHPTQITEWKRQLMERASKTFDKGMPAKEPDIKDLRATIYGTPDIFDTDQGSQFTSDPFVQILKDHHIEISMDGRTTGEMKSLSSVSERPSNAPKYT